MIRCMTPVNLTEHIGVPLDRRPRLAVAGAGARGSTYAELAADAADIVAVAEPRDHHRAAFAGRHPGAAVYTDWRNMVAAGRLADAVIIATQDADHVAAAVAFADAGYDILLEKPMATNESDCARIVAASMTEAELTVALREGPYGRCVYACDNDVVDHQVVNVEYAGGVTASFTLTAFTPMESRHTALFGTHAEIRGDGRYLRIYDFATERTETLDTMPADGSIAAGHDGGDAGLITAFVRALAQGDPSLITSGA